MKNSLVSIAVIFGLGLQTAATANQETKYRFNSATLNVTGSIFPIKCSFTYKAANSFVLTVDPSNKHAHVYFNVFKLSSHPSFPCNNIAPTERFFEADATYTSFGDGSGGSLTNIVDTSYNESDHFPGKASLLILGNKPMLQYFGDCTVYGHSGNCTLIAS